MPRLTFYPLGNADTILLDTANDKKILFDYAHARTEGDRDDKRVDLATLLSQDLEDAGRTGYDIFAITHLDDDHTRRADEFFNLDHARRYQSDARAKIGVLWVPAAAIIESRNNLEAGAKALQAEARHRLVEGYGVRVFSRPEMLRSWLEERGIRLAARQHLITDAGQLAPELTTQVDGVECFVHSPFAWRLDAERVVDRNTNSLVVQLTFVVDGVATRVILASDVDHTALSQIVRTTRRHKRHERLMWDLLKLPHHCSYLSLAAERGDNETVPVEDVRWFLEDRGQAGARIVSTSKPIPVAGTDADRSAQPPHRQAANYYRRVLKDNDGEFLVTMAHPSEIAPKPVVIEIDRWKARVRRAQITGVGAATSASAPRAG